MPDRRQPSASLKSKVAVQKFLGRSGCAVPRPLTQLIKERKRGGFLPFLPVGLKPGASSAANSPRFFRKRWNSWRARRNHCGAATFVVQLFRGRHLPPVKSWSGMTFRGPLAPLRRPYIEARLFVSVDIVFDIVSPSFRHSVASPQSHR